MPGSGKTTLALQFLLEGARRGEPVLYVTLSETEEELRGVAASHGWSLDGITIRELVPSEDSLRPDEQYTMFHPSEVELSETTKTILADVERIKPARVVFDSLSELRLLAGNPLRYRRQILALKQFFAGRNCTVLLLDDLTSTNHDLQVQSIAHGVVRLEQLYPGVRVGAAAADRAQVPRRPLPGRVSRLHHPARRHRGLSRGWSPANTARRRRWKSSPAASPRWTRCSAAASSAGTSTLIVGAAGTGKSSLAAQFVAAAAARGQNAALFIFDESINTLLTRTAGLGIDLRKHVDEGRVTVQQVDPAELSPGEFAHAIRRAVEHQQASIVVIDSLNGYLNAMPEERFLIIQLHELLTYLGQAGVATILIGAHQGLIGGQMITPVDASYLADAVILMRYYETKGEVRQAISVVKKRGGAHERTIREFRLESGRISVGQPLRDFRGVLTGVPIFEGASDLVREGKTVVTEHDRESLEQRVLVLAPTGKDAALTQSILGRAGVACVCCANLAAGLRRAGGAARAPCCWPKRRSRRSRSDCLTEWLAPPAAVVRPAGAGPGAARGRFRRRGPGHGPARQRHGAGAADAGGGAGQRRPHGLRARQRQYQIRDHLAERERSIEAQARLGRHRRVVRRRDHQQDAGRHHPHLERRGRTPLRLFGRRSDRPVRSRC